MARLTTRPRFPTVARSSLVGAPAAVLVVAVLLGACGAPAPDESTGALAPTAPTAPPPDTIASGPARPEVDEAAASLFVDPLAAPSDDALEVIASSDDLRFAWFLVDRLRYGPESETATRLVDRLAQLTGVDAPAEGDAWTHYTDLLLAWDVSAPPGYLERKSVLHLAHDPTATPFFDADAAIDWRLVSASGSARDEMAPLDDPTVTAASEEADWVADDDVVFGVEVDGTRRAYPRRVLRAHEIVNDTLGERRIAVTYCEVCDAAVAWYLDGQGAPAGPTTTATTAPTPEPDPTTLDLGSSGLLLRGAPLAYDRASTSLIDTYTGRAVTGSLADADAALSPVSVVTSTWAEWSADHADTTVVAEDGGVGRVYLDDAPAGTVAVWPVGRRDDRLGDEARVLGVHLDDGSTVAFTVDDVRRTLADDGSLQWGGVTVAAEGGGLLARRRGGQASDEPVPSHEANWRSWSQFHPDTKLWSPGS
jgi:hypothetical protein